MKLDPQEKEILEAALEFMYDTPSIGMETKYDIIQAAKKVGLRKSFTDELYRDYLEKYN